MIVRRALSILTLATLLGACGFTPLYAPNASGGMGPSSAGLSAINVALMGERSGQLLRDALQRRFAVNGNGSAKLYNLTVSFYVANEGVSIERGESIPTRNRSAGIATWSLSSNDAEQRTITSGRARQLDGNNPLSLQYFYSDLQTEQTQARLVEAVADQITTQLATYFATHPSGA